MKKKLEVTYQIWLLDTNGWHLPDDDYYRNPNVDRLESVARFIKQGVLKRSAVRAFINGRYSRSLSIEPKIC